MIELISRQSLLKKYDAEHKGAPGRARRLIEEEPTVVAVNIEHGEETKTITELRAHIEYLNRENENLRGQIKALAFAVRCDGVSGSEVKYEVD